MSANSTLRRERHTMPTWMRAALNDNGFMSSYKKRPPYQQNDYIYWISSPKTEATRQKRLAQMLEELKSGDVYMKMKWNGKKA
ncbi:MAG: YdeI/OmpD-associated family protein [Flavitalea sp.]